jgi:predicted nucleotidyltransferase
MDSKPLVKTYRKEILERATRNGAVNVRIFGSVARGDDRPDRDIDFARLLRELSTLLDHPVDVVTEAGLRPRIKSQVLKEARPL